MSDFFKGIDPSPSRAPTATTRWPSASTTPTVVLGKPMREHLRMAVAYWHSFAWPGGDPFGGQTFQRPWFRDGMRAAELKAEVAFEMFESSAPTSTPSTTATSPPRARPRRVEPQPPRDRRTRAEDGGDRRQAALGHRQPVHQPPLHGRRRHQPQPRGLRLRRGAGEEVPSKSPTTRGANYVFWGGREGYETLLNTDMKRELDHLGPVPAHGGRLQEEDRLQGPVPHRAEAEGADQAPVRLRRRHGLRLPAALRPGATSS